jgi:hypothetical protein
VHLQARVLANEDAGGAGVVEVDVTEEQVTHVLKRQAMIGQSLLQRCKTRRRAAVEERGAVGRVEQVAPDDALGPAVVEID